MAQGISRTLIRAWCRLLTLLPVFSPLPLLSLLSAHLPFPSLPLSFTLSLCLCLFFVYGVGFGGEGSKVLLYVAQAGPSSCLSLPSAGFFERPNPAQIYFLANSGPPLVLPTSELQPSRFFML